MNTPTTETERLILRKFTEDDLEALYQIYRDEEVNTFLPWFPLKTMEEARIFYEEHYAKKYRQNCAYSYAVCLKKDNFPVGYVNVSTEDSYDFGYGLKKRILASGDYHRGRQGDYRSVKKRRHSIYNSHTRYP